MINLIGRLAASALGGNAAMGDGRPDNSQADMSALAKLYAQTKATNRTPNGRVARGFDQFGPQHAMGPYPNAPMLPTPPTPAPVDMGTPEPVRPALSQGFEDAQWLQGPNGKPPAASAPAPVTMPMPAPRPEEAPQNMGFFARNTAMMQDPSSGSFLDPASAARAQASGPDVIQKLLDMFHRKEA